MRIKKVTIKNVLCFKKIDIDLSNNETANNWTLLLGNNGVGKTTFMRSIALCLCEESGASGLLDELSKDWIRNESKDRKAVIRIEFEPVKGYKNLPYIETVISGTRFGEIELKQEIYPKKSKLWDKLFICGYGANRRSFGTTSYSEYTVTDSVYSLFNYATPMQNIELNIRRIQNEIDLEDLFRKLEDILMLDQGAIRMRRNGIHINGPWGSYMPIGALGDGYQATMAWIMDMYGWKMLFEDKLENAEIKGIVFLDEIEQHLHPIWQKEILRRLNRQFKEIQFIVTTHSPLVALNSTGKFDSNLKSKLFVFDWVKNEVKVSEIEEPLNELDYDQLLASEAFGHLYEQHSERSEFLKELSQLASIDHPNNIQLIRLNKIKEELRKQMFPQGDTLIEREVERDYQKELIEENETLRAIFKKDVNDKN